MSADILTDLSADALAAAPDADLIRLAEQRGERIEMLSAYGDPDRCELRFYRR